MKHIITDWDQMSADEKQWMIDIAAKSSEGEEFISYGEKIGYNWAQAKEDGLSPQEAVDEIRNL